MATGTKLGNVSVSALVRSANAGANAYQSQVETNADYTWQNSAKTSDDWTTYQNAINGVINHYKGSDTAASQTKVDSLNQKLVTGNNAFIGAQITRASIAIDQGGGTTQDKANLVAKLYNQGMQNGTLDGAEQQRLALQFDTLQKQADNEAITAQNQADIASQKAATALNKSYEDLYKQVDDAKAKLTDAEASGQITPGMFDKMMQQIYMGNSKTNAPGLLTIIKGAQAATGDPNGTWQDRLDTVGSDATAQKYINGDTEAQTQEGYPGQVIERNGDGTYKFTDRGAGEVAGSYPVLDQNGKQALDANGHAIINHIFAAPQATTGGANSAHKGQITAFEYATNIDPNTGKFAPGTGLGAIRKVNESDLNYTDPSGVPFFYDDNGQKKYVGTVSSPGADGKPVQHEIMANTPDIIQGKPHGASTERQAAAKANPNNAAAILGMNTPYIPGSPFQFAASNPLKAVENGAKFIEGLPGDVKGFLNDFLGGGKSSKPAGPAPIKPGSTNANLPKQLPVKTATQPAPPKPSIKPGVTSPSAAPKPSGGNIIQNIANSAPVQDFEHGNLIGGVVQGAKDVGNAIGGGIKAVGNFLGGIHF